MPGWSPRAARAALATISLCLFSFGFTAPAAAQSGDGSDRIGQGDVVRVEVVGHPELSATVTVDEAGGVTLPSVGAIRASGRTTAELSADISRRISLTQRETLQVRVAVVESRTQKIFVLGAVLLPGAYTYRPQQTVWDVIAEAGGPSEDADLAAVEVIPGDLTSGHAKVTIDVAAAIRSGAYSTLERVKPGDTVRVPRMGASSATSGGANIVYVMGAVSAQGAQGLAAPNDLISTVIRSGPSPEADLSKIDIVRREGSRLVQMRVNAKDYLAQAQPNGNPELRPGDTIYVPRQSRGFGFFSVIGYVSPVIALATSIALLAR